MSKDHPGFLAAKWQNGKKFSPRPAVRKGDNTIVFHKFLDCPASVFCCRGRQGHHCCRPHLVPLLQDSSNFFHPDFLRYGQWFDPMPKSPVVCPPRKKTSTLLCHRQAGSKRVRKVLFFLCCRQFFYQQIVLYATGMSTSPVWAFQDFFLPHSGESFQLCGDKGLGLRAV